jgi:hypothetical protein
MIFGELPPEIAEQMEKQRDLLRMNAEDQVARQTQFFENLSADDLMLVRNLIRGTAQDPAYGQFLNGWMSHLLSAKYNVCGFCDEVHETPEALFASHEKKAEQ